MQTRKCKQCTELKPIEQFRTYYNRISAAATKGNAPSRYLQCLECEQVNNAYKYAKCTNNLQRVAEIEDIYKLCAQKGGVIPGAQGKVIMDDILHKLKLKLDAEHKPEKTDYKLFTTDEWLTKDLSNYNVDDMMDFIQGPFKAKLMPEIGIESDPNNYKYGLPIFDLTHKATWDSVFDKVYAMQ